MSGREIRSISPHSATVSSTLWSKYTMDQIQGAGIIRVTLVLIALHFVRQSNGQYVHQTPHTVGGGSPFSVAVGDLNTMADTSDSITNTIELLKGKMKSMQENKKNDLVFLIDASFSVGSANFRSEVKFVRKVLNGFRVSFNFTRVAVVPFSSSKKVVSVRGLVRI